MGRFDNILILSDLDGTLLRRDKSISIKNKAAIDYFCKNGGIFTFVTGRSPKGALPVIEQLTPNAPIGCLNGCGIFDIQNRKYLYKKAIDPSVIKIVEYIDKSFPKIGIELVGFDNIYFAKKNESTETHKKDEKLDDLICDYHFPKEPISKILLAGKSNELTPMIEALKNHQLSKKFSFILSDKEYFEILPLGASKGALISELSKLLSIPKNRTIAIGDNDNDISMLNSAGIGIAVANASKSAKMAADIITVGNEDDAIAKVIENLDANSLKNYFD